jgi:hypothetical protein
MSNCEAIAIAGWLLTRDFIINYLCEQRKEVSHHEDRFDPLTGNKVDPVLVVDSKGGPYYKGEIVDTHYGLFMGLNDHIQSLVCDLEIFAAHNVNDFFLGKEIDNVPIDRIPNIISSKERTLAVVEFKVQTPPIIHSFVIEN